jgi:hypothetical protein
MDNIVTPNFSNMYTQIKPINKKRKISEVLVISAVTLLIIDTANTLISRGTYGFLPLTDQQSGVYLGLPSIVLFFASFGLGFRQNSRIITSLLVAGGALLVVSKIVEPTMGSNLYLAIVLPSLYLSLIAIGFILMGLGLLRAVSRQ